MRKRLQPAWGWFANAIWVSPTSDDLVIVGGVDLWRSPNGGQSLVQIRTLAAHARQKRLGEFQRFGKVTQAALHEAEMNQSEEADMVYNPIVVHKNWNKYDMVQVGYNRRGHGGGDQRLQDKIFKNPDNPDPLKHAAGVRDEPAALDLDLEQGGFRQGFHGNRSASSGGSA